MPVKKKAVSKKDLHKAGKLKVTNEVDSGSLLAFLATQNQRIDALEKRNSTVAADNLKGSPIDGPEPGYKYEPESGIYVYDSGPKGKQSEVEHWLEDVSKSISALDAAREILLARIAPVLQDESVKNETGTGAGAVCPDYPLSPVANRLRTFSRQIDSQTRLISQVIDRLEV